MRSGGRSIVSWHILQVTDPVETDIRSCTHAHYCAASISLVTISEFNCCHVFVLLAAYSHLYDFRGNETNYNTSASYAIDGGDLLDWPCVVGEEAFFHGISSR